MSGNRFDIDFFEFSFLVEACIPPRPIARAMFWDNVINKYYNILTDDERAKLYEWINRNGNMEHSLEKGNEDCEIFNARFNPENQFKVHYDFNGEQGFHICFKYKERYYMSKNSSIEEGFITKIEKL